jgi:hypothetical protein
MAFVKTKPHRSPNIQSIQNTYKEIKETQVGSNDNEEELITLQQIQCYTENYINKALNHIDNEKYLESLKDNLPLAINEQDHQEIDTGSNNIYQINRNKIKTDIEKYIDFLQDNGSSLPKYRLEKIFNNLIVLMYGYGINYDKFSTIYQDKNWVEYKNLSEKEQILYIIAHKYLSVKKTFNKNQIISLLKLFSFAEMYVFTNIIDDLDETNELYGVLQVLNEDGNIKEETSKIQQALQAS